MKNPPEGWSRFTSGVYYEEATRTTAELYERAIETLIKAKKIVIPDKLRPKHVIAMVKSGDKPIPMPALVTSFIKARDASAVFEVEPERSGNVRSASVGEGQ